MALLALWFWGGLPVLWTSSGTVLQRAWPVCPGLETLWLRHPQKLKETVCGVVGFAHPFKGGKTISQLNRGSLRRDSFLSEFLCKSVLKQNLLQKNSFSYGSF